MQLPEFGVEAWLNEHEKQATYDLAQSTIASLTLDELFKRTGDDLGDRPSQAELRLDRRLARI